MSTDPTPPTRLSRSQELQDRLAVFAISIGACIALGVVISFIWNISVADAAALCLGLYGGVLLATGGASGGGYRRMSSDGQGGVDVSPRNEVSPKSLRQVATGAAYLAIGLAIAVIFG